MLKPLELWCSWRSQNFGREPCDACFSRALQSCVCSRVSPSLGNAMLHTSQNLSSSPLPHTPGNQNACCCPLADMPPTIGISVARQPSEMRCHQLHAPCREHRALPVPFKPFLPNINMFGMTKDDISKTALCAAQKQR